MLSSSGKTQLRSFVRRSRLALCCRILLLLPLLGAGQVWAVDLVTSPNDERDYRYLLLPNQLQVLLISDPGVDKAAASLDVFVGSASDPLDRQGLAHFLEHMLFLGTEKYPEPDEYQGYINEHGGSHNAYTSFEHTNYFFDIDSGFLEPGLDRFAQFFTAPLLAEDYVDRERNAVHSEYQARLKDEYRRTLDVYRQLMNPVHPLTKFSVGNLTTLANDEEGRLREDLLEFYQRHYNARAMTLVVLGRESLDELESMVKPRFAEVPNRDPDEGEASAAEAPPLFLSEDLPMQVRITPEKEVRQLSLMFPIPPIDRLYRKKPSHYLGNLLGHEGEGSLLSVLKEQGWAEALSAGTFLSTRDSALFRINISLTEAGLEERQAIVGMVFAAIERIARSGIEEWRFVELQRLGEIAFRFQEEASPIATVRTLSPNLHYYEAAEAISGDYLLQEYDPELIRHFASFLNPDNVVVTTTAPGVTTDRTTDFFATPYSVERTPVELAELPAGLAQRLDLPEANPFIPEDLALKPKPTAPGSAELAADQPRLLRDVGRIRAWFKQDEVFDVPRASTFLRIKSPEAADSLQGATLMRLYVAMVQDSLNEYTYPARLAGLYHSLQANSRGLDVMVSGYNDGQDELFRRVVEQLQNPRFSRERFTSIKRELLRRWQNISLNPPYEQLLGLMPTLLFSPWWSDAQYIETLRDLSYDDLNSFGKRAFVDSRAELLVYGNLTRAEAAKLVGLVEAELLQSVADKTLPAAEVVKLREVSSLDTAPVFAKKVRHNDRATILYLQGNGDSLNDRAYALLLRQVLRTPFFHQLRTEQQLGYVVFVTGMPFKDVPGTALVVQSPTASLGNLMQAIQDFARKIPALVPKELAQHKSAVVNQLLEAPKNLQEQASRYWESIVDDDASFARRERLAEAVMAIEPKELRAYAEDITADQSRALWVLAAANPFASTRDEDGAGEEEQKPQQAALEEPATQAARSDQQQQQQQQQQKQEQQAQTGGGETGPDSKAERRWMPIDQWPVFKAERESYLYP